MIYQYTASWHSDWKEKKHFDLNFNGLKLAVGMDRFQPNMKFRTNFLPNFEIDGTVLEFNGSNLVLNWTQRYRF